MGFNLKKALGLGDIGSSGDAPHLRQLGLDQLLGLEVPEYDPLKGTAYDSISEDPAARGAQMQALHGLLDYADDGQTAQSKARLNDITDQFNQQAKGNRLAVLENARARGVAGSGLEQANNLLSSQEAAMTGNRQATQAAADAESRALQALSSAGTMGGNVRGQDYQVASDRAKAKDTINQFNTGLKQQQFEDQFSKANAIGGDYNQMAQAEEERRRRKDQFKAGLLGTGAQLVGSFANRRAA